MNLKKCENRHPMRYRILIWNHVKISQIVGLVPTFCLFLYWLKTQNSNLNFCRKNQEYELTHKSDTGIEYTTLPTTMAPKFDTHHSYRSLKHCQQYFGRNKFTVITFEYHTSNTDRFHTYYYASVRDRTGKFHLDTLTALNCLILHLSLI